MLPLGITARRAVPLRTHLGEVVTMAAVVTLLLGVPVGAVLAGLLFFFDVSLLEFVTLGGALGAFPGAVAWCLVAFAPALVYSAYVLPWERAQP